MPDDLVIQKQQIRMLTDRDRLRVEFQLTNGVPTDMMVQLECDINGRGERARRYDTHVSLHVHTAPWDEGGTDRRVPVRVGGLKEALTLAIDDIQANWERYRAACESGVTKEEG